MGLHGHDVYIHQGPLLDLAYIGGVAKDSPFHIRNGLFDDHHITPCGFPTGLRFARPASAQAANWPHSSGNVTLAFYISDTFEASHTNPFETYHSPKHNSCEVYTCCSYLAISIRYLHPTREICGYRDSSVNKHCFISSTAWRLQASRYDSDNKLAATVGYSRELLC